MNQIKPHFLHPLGGRSGLSVGGGLGVKVPVCPVELRSERLELFLRGGGPAPEPPEQRRVRNGPPADHGGVQAGELGLQSPDPRDGGQVPVVAHRVFALRQGQGELGSIVVDAQADGTVRGFVDNPEAGLDGDPNVTAGSLIGLPGTLTVTKDLSMSENWSGTVELQNGEIGQDFAYYFTLSEQTPTAVSVGVRMNEEGKVLAAGALVLQMMPDADDTNIRICEHVLSGLKPMTAIIQDYDDASLALLAEDLFDDTEVLETIPISFKCTCSKEKTAGLLHTVAPDQIKAMIEEDHGAEVTCNFCSSTYHFNEHELREILNDTEKHLEETEELESHVAEDSGN